MKIAIVVPHKSTDEDNVANIAQLIGDRFLAEDMSPIVLINHEFRKPLFKEDILALESFSLEDKIGDLNYLEHALQVPDWMEQLNSIKDDTATPYFVLFLHGASDTGIDRIASRVARYNRYPSKVRGIVGYGQGQEPIHFAEEHPTPEQASDRLIMPEVNVVSLLVNWRRAGYDIITAPRHMADYRARSLSNMAQYFYGLPHVQTLQLELRKIGVREAYAVEHTVDVLFKGIHAFMNR